MLFGFRLGRISRPRNKVLFHQSHVFAIALLIALFLQAQGYADPASQAAEMDKMATNIVDTIFAPWVRKTALAFGGGWGMFQSISAGSFKPLLIWGGLGLIVNFIPKMISWF